MNLAFADLFLLHHGLNRYDRSFTIVLEQQSMNDSVDIGNSVLVETLTKKLQEAADEIASKVRHEAMKKNAQ